jgi:predicted transcriptional regulator
MIPHHVYGGRVHGERDSAPEQPDPTHRLSPLAQAHGKTPSYAMPTCEDCRAATPAIYQLCLRAVIERQPFARYECNTRVVRTARPLRAPKRTKAAQAESRERIYNLLRERGPLEIKHLRAALNMTEDEVKTKLEFLVAQGRIRRTEENRQQGYKTRYFLWHAND